MNLSTVESPAMKMNKRGSWSMFTDMACDMVNGLDLRDDVPHGTSSPSPAKPQQNHRPPRSSSPVRTKAVRRGSAWSRFSAEDDSDPKPQQNHNLPCMHNEPPPMRAVRRGSGWSLFSSEDEYDPNMDLKSQAKQQSRSRFPSASISVPTKKGQSKRDPLMEFHRKHSIAEGEFQKQKEAEKRRRQCRDHDEDKSVGSMSSLFDFLTSSGAAGQLLDESSNDGASLAGASTQSRTNFMGLFGDDAEEIAKLSSPKPAVARRAEGEGQSLQNAVKKSKSVKGNRVYLRGRKEAERGDWRKAVAYYHIALVKQRKHYGEDHVVTSNTLNALGVALTHLGEHFGALTALEEALQIRQELLGAGAAEVAETTSNIWLVLKASQDG